MDSFDIGATEVALAVALLAGAAFYTGRWHQRSKQERDAHDAYRMGSDQASRFMLSLTRSDISAFDADGGGRRSGHDATAAGRDVRAPDGGRCRIRRRRRTARR